MEVDFEEEENFHGRWTAVDSDVVWTDSGAGVLSAVNEGKTKIEVGQAEKESLLAALEEVASRLHSLSLLCCDLDAPDVVRLGDLLRGTRIQGIGVSNNPDIDVRDWAAFWAKLPVTVTKWDFGDNNLPDEALPLLLQAACRGNVQDLLLDGNNFTDISPLLQVVAQAPNLNELDIGDNNIGDEQAKALIERLPGSSLSTLVLGRNFGLTDSSCLSFASVLPRCRIARLYLDSTQITDATLNAIGGVLSLTQLEELDIDGTLVQDAGLINFCEKVPMSKLRTLEVGDRQLSQQARNAMEAVLDTSNMEDDDL